MISKKTNPVPLMCRLHTEGTQHGCGHYIISKKLAKEDCYSQFCVFSEKHPMGFCGGCGQACKRYMDPDASQSITRKTSEWCTHCQYWFKGDGAKRKQ